MPRFLIPSDPFVVVMMIAVVLIYAVLCAFGVFQSLTADYIHLPNTSSGSMTTAAVAAAAGAGAAARAAANTSSMSQTDNLYTPPLNLKGDPPTIFPAAIPLPSFTCCKPLRVAYLADDLTFLSAHD